MTKERRINAGRREYDNVWYRLLKAEEALAVLTERTTHNAGGLDSLQEVATRLADRVQQNTEANWALKTSLVTRLNIMLWGLIGMLVTMGGGFLLLFSESIAK